MAKKPHPYIDAVKVGALVSVVVVLLIVCLALFVGSLIQSSHVVPEERAERNLTQHGALYSRDN